MSQLLLTPPTELDIRREEADTRDREDDPTPRLLVRAILAEALTHVSSARPRYMGGVTLRALDVCAGYGVFASELRRHAKVVGYPVHITGIEICEARREHLRKWCDNAVIGDERNAIALGDFDVAIGNPHFTALVGKDGPAESMPARLLEHCKAVLLYHTRNEFVRSETGRAVWRAYPPAHVFVVPGTVSHDGTSAVASDCYQVSLWRRGHTGPTTEQLLDVEPKAKNLVAGIVKRGGEPYSCWRWTVPPGSEEPSEDLPGVVGWQR